MRKILYSIVVPVYKTSASLVELVKRTDRTFANIPNSAYELIFVNDSPFYQKTTKTLVDISTQYKNVVIVELTKNFGQQPATVCGIEIAKGDYIITMDDDLQHAPEDIINLIQEQEHDVVIAKFETKQHSFFKQQASNIKGFFDHIILKKPKHIKLTPFRLFKGSIAKEMFRRKTPYPFIPALLFSITDDIVNVNATHHSRYDGTSNYTFRTMFQMFSNLMINNSSFLLKIIGYIGITTSFFSVIFAAIIIFKKIFFLTSLPGWTSLIITILFFGGLILFSLGIIGEYLIRIIATTENRPMYFVRKIIRKNDHDE